MKMQECMHMYTVWFQVFRNKNILHMHYIHTIGTIFCLCMCVCLRAKKHMRTSFYIIFYALTWKMSCFLPLFYTFYLRHNAQTHSTELHMVRKVNYSSLPVRTFNFIYGIRKLLQTWEKLTANIQAMVLNYYFSKINFQRGKSAMIFYQTSRQIGINEKRLVERKSSHR